MSFVSTFWLLLVPWLIALVRWLMRFAEPAIVPHLDLWRRQSGAAVTRWSLKHLPIAPALIFAGTLLAIVALGLASRGSERVSIAITPEITRVDIEPWLSKFSESLRRRSLTADVRWLPPDQTADSTASAAVIITSQPIRQDGVSVVNVPIERPMTLVAARFAENPPQLMVTLRNNHATAGADISLESDPVVSRQVELPPVGRDRNYFIDCPAIPRDAQLTVSGHGRSDWKIEQTLQFEAPSPALVATTPLPPVIAHFIDVYTRLHPPGATAAAIRVGELLDDTQPGVIVPSATSESRSPTAIEITPQEIVAHANLQLLKNRPMDFAAPVLSPWRPIVQADGRPILAIKDQPSRQVWLGFSSKSFEAENDFVILLADIVNWLNHSTDAVSPSFDASSPALPDPDRVAARVAEDRPKDTSWLAPLCWCSLACIGAAGFISLRR